MPAFQDLTGQKFGHLTVIKRGNGKLYENQKYKFTTWICQCDCENRTIKEIDARSLKSGLTTSCGCIQKGKARKSIFLHNQIEHDLKNTRLYSIWTDMKRRCKGTKKACLDSYYKKRITVCPEWNGKGESFLNFYNWAIQNGYQDNLTIDRINNDGNYEPSNCRWVSMAIQNINKNIFKNNTSGYTGVKFDKKSQKWIAEINVNYKRIYLGSFHNKEDAIAARKAAEEKYHKPLLQSS